MQRGAKFTIVSTMLTKTLQSIKYVAAPLVIQPTFLNNTEKFPMWEKYEIVNFSWLLFLTLMISWNLLIKKYHISKWSLNTFHFINCFSVVLWIFCVKMKSFVSEERVLPQNKRNFFPHNLVVYVHNENHKTKLVLIKTNPCKQNHSLTAGSAFSNFFISTTVSFWYSSEEFLW